jgi:2-nitropropane dioxygenase NPD
MLAAMALGAEGVQVGSRFVATAEASVHPAFKEKVVAAGEGDTELTLKELAPVRLLKNGFYQQVKDLYNTQQATVANLQALVGNRRTKRGMFEGDIAEGELEIGQVAALIDKVQTAKEVIDEMVAEYEASLARVNTF